MHKEIHKKCPDTDQPEISPRHFYMGPPGVLLNPHINFVFNFHISLTGQLQLRAPFSHPSRVPGVPRVSTYESFHCINYIIIEIIIEREIQRFSLKP